MNKVIAASAIGRKFGNTRALENVSFDISESEIFGFIGPDGAGKTTLFRIITTLLLPDEGKMTIMGLDCRTGYRQLRKNIGYMPGRFSLYPDLSVEENLNFYATVFGTTVKENYDLIYDIYSHIEPSKKRLAGKLSGGMKQKLALSCALIHKPGLLVLDEPSLGLAPLVVNSILESIEKLRSVGLAILLIEQNAAKSLKIAQRGYIMELGTIILSGDSKELLHNEMIRKAYIGI